jgi:hypothetical protein
MQHSWDFERLSQACTQEGCVLCRLAEEDTQRYLETWKDEEFTEVDVREELRRSKGFCHTHTRQLVQMGASLSLAVAYRDVITDAIEQLQQAQKGQRRHWFEARRELAGVSAPCPACRKKEQSLTRLIVALRAALPDRAFSETFAASSGLCLPHFQLAYELRPLDGIDIWLPLLRNAQLGCLQRLEGQLAEMIRKHDYRFKDEPRGTEMASWQRAAGIVAGEDERIQ